MTAEQIRAQKHDDMGAVLQLCDGQTVMVMPFGVAFLNEFGDVMYRVTDNAAFELRDALAQWFPPERCA